MKIGVQTTDVMTEKYPKTEEDSKLTVTEKQGSGENKGLSESLEDRIRFETLISDISARFVNISPDQVDPEINHALKQILEFFQVDRVGLMRSLPDRSAYQITHGAYGEDVPAVPVGVELPRSIYPWAYEKLAEKHEVVSFSRLDDLPPEAGLTTRS